MTRSPEVVTVTAAARFIGVGRTAVFAMCTRKELVSEMIAGTPHIRVDSLPEAARKKHAAWIAKQEAKR